MEVFESSLAKFFSQLAAKSKQSMSYKTIT